jgi:hypothetical protein
MCKKSTCLFSFVLVLSLAGRGWPGVAKPNPPDGALLDDTWANLSWQPGPKAASFDVYLGDDFDSVKDGTGETFRGSQTSPYFVVGFPGYPYPDGLVPGTTYYWRVDELQTDGTTVHKGSVWSFAVPGKTARAPKPADGAQFIDPANLTLTWTPGFRAKLHTVYFGDDFDVVSNATGGLPQGVTSYKPSAVKSEKVYYWRVDEFDSVATYKGEIWAFTTPGAVGDPQPANGAVDVQMTAKLSWTPATNAASHQVYFGTDKDAVRKATTASPEYKGSKALGSETLDPGKLAWHSDYYWRVDAVYNTGTVKGLVWTFTTADFSSVDDFESYNDIDPPDPASNRIFEAWIDGFGTTDNGALVGNDLPPYAERTAVHGGAQSMPYFYDNNLKTSEATLTLVYPRDWTENDVNTLTLWFRGNKSNAAEQMYIALNGNAVVYNGDPKASQMSIWTGWNTDLKAFADQGVNLKNVNTITIGFGTKNSPAAGGSGKVYFDDIRLATAAVPVGRILLLDEDFEELPLGPNVEEALSGTEVWTDTPPSGWSVDDSGVPGKGNPAIDGVTEWAGWAFTNKDWWVTIAEDQRRSEFTLGQGTVAVADPDEWDDAAHPPGYNVAADPYDTWLSTPSIDISGCAAGSVQLEFSSSWRPEYDDNYHQTANITASYNGEEPIEVLRWESNSASPNYKPDNSTNETITVNLDNPPWATSVVLTFGLFDAGNDWWWAIDNVKVSGSPK